MAHLRHGSWLIAFAITASLTTTALADKQPPSAGGANTGGGLRTTLLFENELANARADEQPGIRYEYRQVAYCAYGPEDLMADNYCEAAVRECANNTPDQGLGPAMHVFRRALDPETGPWESRGTTCFPDLTGDNGPQLTMAMIIEAFHDTAFAVPEVNVQPVGGTTLVTLPTYYEVAFADEGFASEDVDTVNLMGFTVEIRPTLQAITYDFGDGNTLGPTTDRGGPHPTGTVIHAYDRRGAVTVRADVTYGGQFRVNGGDWNDIPGSSEITGTGSPLAVKESRARLVSGGG